MTRHWTYRLRVSLFVAYLALGGVGLAALVILLAIEANR